MTLPSPNRRTFLAAVVAAAAGGATTGCSNDQDEKGSSSRRRATTTTTATPLAVPELASDPFLLGVASGDPLPDSVILWTRLVMDRAAADGAMGTADVPVRWEVADDATFDTIVAAGTAIATAALAHSVHVDVSDLEPDRWYSYRFSVGDRVSQIGRTRTMPNDDAEPERLALAFASCQDFTAGYYSAYRAMAADELDLVFFLGDYIYEYGTTETGPRAVLPVTETLALDDYRLRYATYKSDADLQAAHGRCPWVVTWDDHEVENNHAGLSSEGKDPVDEFTARRAAAYQAYYEHQPIRLDPPTGADWRIYRGVRFGSLAEFFVLDGRQYRSDQACNSSRDALVDPSTCPELDDDERTMLGSEQESWLSEGLDGSGAIWKVLAQQTVMSSLVLGNLVLNVDQWDGYPAARRRLFEHLRTNDIRDVVVLTGDIHSAGAGTLTGVVADGAPPTAAVAVEFVGTSITSSTLAGIVPGGEKLLTADTFAGIEYLNVTDHGYGRATVTPTSWTTEFVVVEGIDRADSPARVDATLVVDVGTSALRRA